MAGTPATSMVPRVDGARVLIVESRYHDHIADLLLAGAEAVLRRGGATFERVTVPGALEIPTTIRLAQNAGFDAFVALGCVIRGETIHFDLVAGESCRGITDLGTRYATLIGNGILTVENEAQALERADPARQDKGGWAAMAALSLVVAARRFGASR